MSAPPRRGGRYSPHEGLVLPAEGFTGTPDVPCPDVGDDARAWWATWATSQFAHFFAAPEWLDLADTTRLMDRFYATGQPSMLAEARQHTSNLFGLATRTRLHISTEEPAANPDAAPPERKPRQDPRLRAV